MGIAADIKALCKRIDNIIEGLPKTGDVAEVVRSKAIGVANDAATTLQQHTRKALAMIQYYVDELIAAVGYADFIVLLNALKAFILSIVKGTADDI